MLIWPRTVQIEPDLMRLNPKTSCWFAVPVGVVLFAQRMEPEVLLTCIPLTILAVALCDRMTVVVMTLLLLVVGTFVKLARISPAGLLT